MAYSYDTQKWWQKLLRPSSPGLFGYLADSIATGDWRPGKGRFTANQSEDDYNSDIIAALESEGLDFANLSQSQVEALLNKYWEEDEGMWSTEHTFDYDRFLSDYNAMNAALGERPESPDIAQFWADAQDRASGETATALDKLEQLRQMQVGNFNDELRSLASGYSTARSGILSQQYQQNAQLMDTLSSQMDRQNRNALEAGASAGIRLAGNINTLLSTQNKQSQTSLDTANQLAQMMINQRNAEASVRGRYGDYMNQHFATEQGIRDSEFSKAQGYYNQEYDVADKSYAQNTQKWDEKYSTNPLWDYRGTLGKSNYNKTGG